MSANETHIYFPVDEQDDSHYPVVVALDIEHVSVVVTAVKYEKQGDRRKDTIRCSTD